MSTQMVRISMSIPGDFRKDFDRAIRDCARENGGTVLGDPSLRLDRGFTVFEVDGHAWWNECVKVRGAGLWQRALDDVKSGSWTARFR